MEKATEKEEEYEQLVIELKKKLEEATTKLTEAQMQNKKIQFEVEHEKSVRESIENFRVPMYVFDQFSCFNLI